MIEKEEYGASDPDTPEWTKEDFARSIKFNDLPESLQRTLSKPKRSAKTNSLPGAEGGKPEG